MKEGEREGKMAKYDAKEIAEDAVDVFKMIGEESDLPEWVEAKITISAHNMNAVKDYLTHHMKESVKEADLGLTYKRGKTVKVKHKKSGKTLVIVDKPVVRKEYEKIGYFAESVNEKVDPEMKKIYQLLIKYGNNAKDAAAMIKKNLKYVNKAYRNSSPRDKAVVLVGLSGIGESVNKATQNIIESIQDNVCINCGNIVDENLRKWFDDKWVNIGKKDKSGKHPECGTSGKTRGYAKCVPKSKASGMSKKDKESATRRKRAAQNKANRGGTDSTRGGGKKAINVSTKPKK